MLRKIHYLLNRKRLDQELAEEMEFHREMAAAKDGVPFGNPLRLREEVRDSWGWTWIDDLQQDLKYGLRKLSATPGFTAMAVLMLAVGIGVNVAAFGFFNMVALRPLPVRDAQSLLRFQREAQDSFSTAIAYPAFEFYRNNARTVSGWIGVSRNSLRINDETQTSAVHFVNADYFTQLGAGMQMGRSFGGEREVGVAVLSYGYWQRRFGGDPSILGKTILLNQTPATVIGVSSKQFSGLHMEAPAAWLRLEDHPTYVSGSTLLTNYSTGTKGVIAKGAAGIECYGRLVEGSNRSAAAQELQALTAELRKQHPDDFWEQERITSEAGGYALQVREEMMPMLILGATLCLLILIAACGNLGGLLMARGVARQREMAIRRDIGAGRGRLVKQLFTESLLLAGMGLVAGLILAYAAMQILLGLTEAPEWLEVSADWRVIAFALVLGFLAAIVFGLSPAIQLAKQKTGRMRGILLGAQIAASCVLLIVSGLLVRALNHVLALNPGFEYEQVVAVDPDLKTYGYSTAAAQNYFRTMKARLEGTGSLALTATAPLGRRNVGRAHMEHKGSFIDIYMLRVEPEFFTTIFRARRTSIPG
ncbi:MAG: ABC transporter permease [Acidobacteria bacterium]|nr:ABC transporter permease [Acidobacteriota bacterium]